MKPPFSLIIFISLLALFAQGIVYAQEGSEPNEVGPWARTLITQARVINLYNGSTSLKDIVLDGDYISGIYPAGQALALFSDQADSVQIIDAAGKYAIPGLWDMHVHMTYKPELRSRMSPLMIANGVTSVRDMGAVLEDILAFREEAEVKNTVAPRIYIAGPLVDGSPPTYDGLLLKPAMSTTADTPEEGIRLVDQLVASGVDLIKPYAMLRPEVLLAVIRRAHEHGLLVSGHTPYSVTIQQAMAMGMDGFEHTSGIDVGCSSEGEAIASKRLALLEAYNESEPSTNFFESLYFDFSDRIQSTQNPQTCAALMEQFVQRGTWHTPTIALFAMGVGEFSLEENREWLSAFNYLPAGISLEFREFWRGFKTPEMVDYGKNMIHYLKQMHREGVKLLAGSDATYGVPGFSLHDELYALTVVGLSPLQALQTATINPAQYFGIENVAGNIEHGKQADLLLLDANPLDDIRNTKKIHAVISRGRVFDRHTLDEMLATMFEQ